MIEELGTQLRPIREFVELRVPHGDSAVIARLHEVAQVTERDYAGQQRVSGRASRRIFRAEFAPYINTNNCHGCHGGRIKETEH